MHLQILVILFVFWEKPPPGTIKINDLYVDKTEILNIHWLEYMYYKEQELDSSEYYKILPDSSNFWFKEIEFRYHPLVLISYEQAVDYCKWRSKVVSEKFGINVTYRLPTAQEWQMIAEHLLSEKEKNIYREHNKLVKKNKKLKGGFNLTDRKEIVNQVYDFFGNVSEMTDVKGIAFGNNNSDLEDPKNSITKPIKYAKVSPYLGFRCVAEIKEY